MLAVLKLSSTPEEDVIENNGVLYAIEEVETQDGDDESPESVWLHCVQTDEESDNGEEENEQ